MGDISYSLLKLQAAARNKSLRSIRLKTLRPPTPLRTARIESCWGMTPEEYYEHIAKFGDVSSSGSPMSYFSSYRLRTEKRYRIPFTLTFKEWFGLWTAAGPMGWQQTKDYELIRIDSSKPFVFTNMLLSPISRHPKKPVRVPSSLLQQIRDLPSTGSRIAYTKR